MIENDIKILSDDLIKIHEDSSLRIPNIDDKVLKSIRELYNGKSLSDCLSRQELWFSYTKELIQKIEIFIKDLAKSLVKVREYRVKINQYKRELNKIENGYKSDSERDIKQVQELFYKSIELWNELVESEDELRAEARKSFLSKIYLPFAVAISTGYWTLLTIRQLPEWLNSNPVLYFAIILVALYFILKFMVQTPDKSQEL